MKNSLKLSLAALVLAFGICAPASAHRHYQRPAYYTTYHSYPTYAYYQPVVYQQPVYYERVVQEPRVVVQDCARPTYVERPYYTTYSRPYYRPYYRPYSRGGFSFSVGF